VVLFISLANNRERDCIHANALGSNKLGTEGIVIKHPLDKTKNLFYNVNMIKIKINGRIYYYERHKKNGIRKKHEHHKDFKYKKYRESEKNSFVIECLIRDNYTCQSCGKNFLRKSLHVHHKDKMGRTHTNHPNNSLDNLITLCINCHRQQHIQSEKSITIRGKEFLILIKEGFKLREIGELYHISRQRVLQIIEKYSLKST